jgi:hypothetical protein
VAALVEYMAAEEVPEDIALRLELLVAEHRQNHHYQLVLELIIQLQLVPAQQL